MDRRKIIATAGAITVTVLAGSTAIAANVGILGNGANNPVGKLSPVVNLELPGTSARTGRVTTPEAPETTAATLPPQVETVYVDEYVPVAPRSSDTPAENPAVVPPSTPSASVPGQDDHGDDQSDQGDDDQGEQHDGEDGTVTTSPGDDDHDDAHDNDQADDHDDDHHDDHHDEYEGGDDDD